MKRKATRFLALAMSAVLVTSLTACGDGSDENAKDAVTPVEAQPMLSELELEILKLETKYNKGEFTQEDYLSLADAYNRAGYIRKQRDMLEQDYRLYADEEAFAALQEIGVNLEEETEGIRSRAQEMLNDLELPEYLELIGDCLKILPQETVIHRISGDGPKSILIAPEWSGNKRLVLNSIAKYLKEHHIFQGMAL